MASGEKCRRRILWEAALLFLLGPLALNSNTHTHTHTYMSIYKHKTTVKTKDSLRLTTPCTRLLMYVKRLDSLSSRVDQNRHNELCPYLSFKCALSPSNLLWIFDFFLFSFFSVFFFFCFYFDDDNCEISSWVWSSFGFYFCINLSVYLFWNSFGNFLFLAIFQWEKVDPCLHQDWLKMANFKTKNKQSFLMKNFVYYSNQFFDRL